MSRISGLSKFYANSMSGLRLIEYHWEKKCLVAFPTIFYNTVQMFEPFQIGTKTEVLRLAPGPIWVQQSFLETSPSTFLRCASNETLVKAIALMVPELQLFKETKQGKNCKIKCEFSACSKLWPHSTQNTRRLSTFGNFPCIHMHVNCWLNFF